MITNGRYVVNYGLYPPSFSAISPGSYRIVVEARLPRGTRPGEYSLRILETSEVLYEGYAVSAPELGPPVSLTVASEVTQGWDEGSPPFRFETERREVLGKVEFRLADGAGEPAPGGEPVVEAPAGEEFRLRVQMRTEVPLNQLTYRLEWREFLECVEEGHRGITVMFRNPEDGIEYPTRLEEDLKQGSSYSLNCYSRTGHRVEFGLLGATGDGGGTLPATHKRRPLEYFKPLGEWTDIVEVRLNIDGCAPPGAEIALTFRKNDVSDLGISPPTCFVPYRQRLTCNVPQDQFWSYDIVYHDGFIRVKGDPGECSTDPPPDVGVRYVLGEVAGRRGDVVEVPVMASTEIPAHTLRLGLEVDPPEVLVPAAGFNVQSLGSGKKVAVELRRGEKLTFRECIDLGREETCTYGIPGWVAHSDFVREPRFTALALIIAPYDAWSSHDTPPDYPGRDLIEIARLRVMIPEGFPGSEIRLKPASVPVFGGIFFESGAFARDPIHKEFSPAKEVREGLVRVIGEDTEFLRGDVNLDGLVDLSDAVSILGFLFLGGSELGCRDAADVEDSGEVDITDAVFLLGALYLGSGQVPAPHPGCGADGTLDRLGCQRSGCPG